MSGDVEHELAVLRVERLAGDLEKYREVGLGTVARATSSTNGDRPRPPRRTGIAGDLVDERVRPHSVDAGPGDDSILVHSLEGRYDVAGGSGTDTLITKQCAHSDTGTVVTCGRSTTAYTSIEVHRHRSR